MRSDIRWSLMIRMVLILLVVLIANAGVNSLLTYRQFKHQITDLAGAIGKDIVDEVHQSLTVLEANEQIFAMFNYNLERLVKEREYLDEMALISPTGKYLSNGNPDFVGRQVPEEVMRQLTDESGSGKPFARESSFSVLLPIQGGEDKTAVFLLIGFKKDMLVKPLINQVIWVVLVLVASIIFTATIMNIFALRAVTLPLKRLGKQTEVVASGDLTNEVPQVGASEIKGLASAFNRMLMSLREILLKISRVSTQFTETCQRLFMLSGEITHGGRQQTSTLNEASDSVKKMETNVELIADKVQELNHLSQNTSTSILEMAASIAEVDNNVDHLAGMVDEISSSILEMSESAKEVAGSVESAAREAESSASSISQINTTLVEVESNTSFSAQLSSQVSEVSEEGMKSIALTQDGMRAIRSAVESTASGIDRLREKSTRIGKILGVINKIAEETNLLALNAAIIAAEAGEHGRGFNVVANEIQTLAERTTLQTKEIDGLIRDVQRETMSSFQQARTVIVKVEEGERLTTETAKVLDKIQEASKASQSMIQQIAKATQEQTIGARRVSESSDKVSNEISQIAKATTEQAAGASKIMEAIERIKDLARNVQTATREQSEGSKTISRATEQVREFVTNITNLTEGHRKDASNVSSIVAKNMKIIEENMRRVQEMENGVESLINLTTSLNEEMSRFQFSQRKPKV